MIQQSSTSTPMGKIAQKRQKADAYLKSKIAELNAGEALPPIRQMMQESGLGRNILENRIAELEALKVLEIRERSGIYLSSCSNEPDERIVDIVACSEIGYLNETQSATYIRELVNELLRRSALHGYASRLWRVSYYAPLSEYHELIRKHNLRNAMLIMPHSNEIPRLFQSENVRCTVVMPRYYPGGGPAVIDAPDMVQRQMQYLYDHGHRKIGIIHTVDLGFLSLTDLLRREDYYRFMSEHGLGVRPEWAIHYSTDESVLFPRLDRMMNSPEPPTALVVFEWFLGQVYDYCRARGIEIGRDLSIISSDGVEMDKFSPKPTTVVNPVGKTADLAWRLLLESLDEPRGAAIDYIDLEVREGDSVARL